MIRSFNENKKTWWVVSNAFPATSVWLAGLTCMDFCPHGISLSFFLNIWHTAEKITWNQKNSAFCQRNIIFFQTHHDFLQVPGRSNLPGGVAVFQVMPRNPKPAIGLTPYHPRLLRMASHLVVFHQPIWNICNRQIGSISPGRLGGQNLNKKLELPPPSCVHFILHLRSLGGWKTFRLSYWVLVCFGKLFRGELLNFWGGGGEGENLIVLSYRLLPCDHPERRWWSNHLPGENYDIYMYIYKYIYLN